MIELKEIADVEEFVETRKRMIELKEIADVEEFIGSLVQRLWDIECAIIEANEKAADLYYASALESLHPDFMRDYHYKARSYEASKKDSKRASYLEAKRRVLHLIIARFPDIFASSSMVRQMEKVLQQPNKPTY